MQIIIINYIDGKDFVLGFSEKIDNNNFKSITITSLNQNLHDNINVTFPLKSYGSNSKFGEYNINAVSSPNPDYYSTKSTIVGELKITHHNFNNAIMSGTFWFDAVNSNGEKVQIREGRFDMHY
ncbi:hypothetical protein K5L05_11390 [Flavobacterium psychrophilum]|uniref:DUF6252 family protein n=1 Tax=Flavobacterium psychrophilum TaxID=96345 RepID=UPI001C8FA2D2|nr:hypothetical protein K5L05_11390 [Flavobacterium psychrophilum]